MGHASQRRRHTDIFAVDRLGDAVARLYERYAELLPDGSARTRAAATARSAAVYLSSSMNLEGWATAAAPDLESVDHRTPGLFGSMRGAEAFLRALASLV